MTLTIISNNYDKEFIKWLTSEISIEILQNLDNKQFIPLNKYFNETNVFDGINKPFDLRNIIILAIKFFTFEKIKGGWRLYINPVKKYPHTQISIISLCNLIEDGVFGIKGTHIFLNTFNYVKNNLDEYYERYVNEV